MATAKKRWSMRTGAVALLGGLFLLLAVGSIAYLVLVAGPSMRRQVVDDQGAQLAATVAHRESALEHWVRHAKASGRTLARYPTVEYHVSGRRGPPYPFDPAVGPEESIRQLFGSYVAEHGYLAAHVYTRDPARTVRGSSSERLADPGRVEAFARSVMQQGQPLLRLAPGSAVLLIGAPVGDRGAVVIEEDAASYLFPLLGSDASGSRTEETYLVSRAGEEVEFLTPIPRTAADPARRSADSAMAALLLERGEVREPTEPVSDARVIFAARHVAGTPWWLLSRIDRSEALEEYREDFRRFSLALFGLLIGLLGSGYGLRRRMRARIESRTAEERIRFAKVIDQAADPLLFLDAAGRIRDANRRAEEFYGTERVHLTGRSFETLKPPELRGDRATIADSGDGRVTREETEHVVGSGERVPVELSSRAVELDGSLSHVVTVRDLRARRELERQLRQSQKLEAIGRLAGGVAHDFNNVLTSIQGSAVLAEEAMPDGHPARGDLQEIIGSSKRASHLIRQLLAFSRQQILKPRVVDVGRTVRGIETMLRRLIGEHIRLEVVISHPAPCVLADPGQIEQVLVNLAVNARDAMDKGGVLRIAVEECGDCVSLAVSDTGAGMSESVRERVFEPFFTTKDPGKGTGLGLATVYGIVEQSGGRIEVESREGVGSTFRVRLPLVSAPVEGLAGPEPSAGVADDAARCGGSVLLVEDDPAVRRLGVRILEKLGYAVTAARSGEEALDVLGTLDPPPELLVTDMVMPGMDGRELGERVRQRLPGCQVLLMSGYTEDIVVRQGRLPENMHFIEKPFSPAELVARIRALRGVAS